MSRHVFVDTAFVQALLNRDDQYHERARNWFTHLRVGSELWITEAVLVEVGNALSVVNRRAAVEFIRQAYATANVHAVRVDSALLERALNLYDERPDKQWGLTDCISFVVMANQGLRDALTTDQHFVQAGFQALLLRDPT